MRVLYFHQHFTTPQGATGSRSYEQSRELLKRGHFVTMVCGSFQVAKTGLVGPYHRGKRTGMVDGIHVIEFEIPYKNSDGLVKRSWLFLSFALRSVKLALTEKYDVVFATSTPLTAAVPGIVASVFRRKKFVFEVRDLWPELPKAMGVIKNPFILGSLSLLEWSAYRRATLCIGLSPGMVNGIKRRAPALTPVEMIPNGCDVQLFERAGAEVDAIIPGVSEDDFVAIFPGAHGPANGLNAVLDVAVELQEQGITDIKFVFVGTGREKSALVARAERQDLSNCIFIDPVAKPLLASYLQRADVGLMVLANVPAFYYGTSPNKFFDYLASGMPVVTNYPGWVADIIETEKIGCAVQPEDAKAFADALIDLSNNPNKLALQAENASRLARDSFNRSELVEQFADALERVHSGTARDS